MPVPGGDQTGHDLADLGGGHLGRVISRAEPDRIQRQVHEVRPGSSAATSEYGQPGIICAFPFPRA